MQAGTSSFTNVVDEWHEYPEEEQCDQGEENLVGTGRKGLHIG